MITTATMMGWDDENAKMKRQKMMKKQMRMMQVIQTLLQLMRHFVHVTQSARLKNCKTEMVETKRN